MIYSVYPRDCIYSIALKSGWFDISMQVYGSATFLLQVWLPRTAFKSDETNKKLNSDEECFLDCLKIPSFLSVLWAQTASSQTKKYIKM